MKNIWAWLRSLSQGDWIALLVALGGSAFVVALVAANTWSAVVGSLQPDIVKFKGTEYDLIAQRSMSAAAWWMVLITGMSALVGGLGLYLIARTLQEAKRSADAAEKAVESSRTAIETAREMGQAQVRAHLMVTLLSCDKQSETLWRLLFKVVNCGQTPAYKVALGIVVAVGKNGRTPEEAFRQARSTIDLAPNAASEVAFYTQAINAPILEAWDESRGLGAVIRIEATAWFRDVFSDRQTAHAEFQGAQKHHTDQDIVMVRDVSEE